MDNKTAIQIANGHIVGEGLSTEGLKANVVNPADREFEVAFIEETDGDEQTEHSVFIGPYGGFLGLRLADGFEPTTAPEAELQRDYDEDKIQAATRYLKAHGVDTSGLQSRLVDPPRLVTVWYEEDTDVDKMGGWYTVFMLQSGTVVGLQFDQ